LSLFEALLSNEPIPKFQRRKLTAEDVAEIRRLYSTQGWLQASLAREYGVSQGHISKVVRGLQWPVPKE
jgi:DNA-binding transcriptional regulator LsrR (DeoR family)